MCRSMVDIHSVTAEIRRGKKKKKKELKCGPMPNVMAALPNISGALCSMSNTGVPCSNAAKTRNPLKFAGVSQTNETISAASGPKFTILWGHVEEILLLNKFFLIVDTCLSCEDIVRQSCAMVPRLPIFGDFLVLHLQRAACTHFRPAF